MTIMEDTRGEIKDITNFKQTKELKPTLLRSHILNIDISIHMLKNRMFKHMLETSCLESNTNYGVWSFKIEHVVKKAFG
jgi:hypothetical protein